jgi:hypothetical protein
MRSILNRAQERLPRRRGDCGSRAATNHALRGNQDARADGSAGSASRALAPRAPAYGCDQSNPRLPHRVRQTLARPILLNPLIKNRNRRALGDEWRDGYRVVTPAAMDAWGHHIARRRAAGIEVSCANPLQTMSRFGHHPISRSFSPIGMAPISCSRINFASSVTGVSGLTQSTPLHRVFDFHGGPPLLELGTLDEMQSSRCLHRRPSTGSWQGGRPWRAPASPQVLRLKKISRRGGWFLPLPVS